MKQIVFESRAKPSHPGYPDGIVLLADDEQTMLYHGSASCCPNPVRPSDGANWRDAYAWVACGSYKGVYIEDHHRFGRCVLLEDGGKVPTRFPNGNEKEKFHGQSYADGVFIHEGQDDNWRGSKACLTVPPPCSLWGALKNGEAVSVTIIDHSGMGTR